MIPFFTALVLFWPAVFVLFFLGFCCIVFAIFLIGSTVLLFTIFLYGLYCILRDMGLLDMLFEKIGCIADLLSDHVKKNVEDSFTFTNLQKSEVKGPALYLCHPHGLYGLSWFIHFAIAISKWPFEKRPVLAVHSVFFQLPLFRELFKRNRCIEAKESEIERCLQEGTSVALLVGGVEELLYTEPGVLKLILKKRRGYARLSKRCSVPLVPVVCPGENNLFPPSQDGIWKWIEQQLYTRFRIALPLPSWNSVVSWMTIAYKPFSQPLETYIVNPVYPDEKSTEDIQSAYQTTLEQFAKEHKIPLTFIG